MMRLLCMIFIRSLAILPRMYFCTIEAALPLMSFQTLGLYNFDRLYERKAFYIFSAAWVLMNCII